MKLFIAQLKINISIILKSKILCQSDYFKFDTIKDVCFRKKLLILFIIWRKYFLQLEIPVFLS